MVIHTFISTVERTTTNFFLLKRQPTTRAK